MSKYCYGEISGSKEWYVRLKEWRRVEDEEGKLYSFCRVIKRLKNKEECIKYIDYLKGLDKEEKK